MVLATQDGEESVKAMLGCLMHYRLWSIAFVIHVSLVGSIITSTDPSSR